MVENSSSSQLLSAPARVVLSPEVTERMERDILNTFRAVTGRGAEIGGILLGAPACNGYGAAITGYRLVPCAYTKGPLYVLSDAEKSELREAAREEHALGLFRSHTRRNLALSDEDLALVRDCFPGRHPVFLLVKPFATRPPVAGIFHPNGSGTNCIPAAEFTFHTQAQPGQAPHRVEAPEALASIQPEPEPVATVPSEPVPETAAPPQSPQRLAAAEPEPGPEIAPPVEPLPAEPAPLAAAPPEAAPESAAPVQPPPQAPQPVAAAPAEPAPDTAGEPPLPLPSGSEPAPVAEAGAAPQSSPEQSPESQAPAPEPEAEQTPGAQTPRFAQLPARSRVAKVAWSLFAVALVAAAGLFAYYDGWLPIPDLALSTLAPNPPVPVNPAEQAAAPKPQAETEAAPPEPVPAARTVLSVENQKLKQALPPPTPKPRSVIIPEPPRIDTSLEMKVPLPQIQTPAPPPQAAPQNAPAANPTTFPVTRAPVLLRQQSPQYPVRARTSGVQGTVQLRALIGPDGRVRSVTPLSGPLQLRAAAAAAVQNWTYLPALRQGEPVEGTAEIELRFALRN